MNILEAIVKDKKEELSKIKSKISLDEIQNREAYHRTSISITEALLKPGSSGIIAEFKRHSPSKGDIHKGANCLQITQGYAKEGAAAISILTETKYFKGNDEDLMQGRKSEFTPILRKDFMVDAFQFYEAKSLGADVVLLIASILSKSQTKEFLDLAHSLGMQVILEIHNEKELENNWTQGVDIVGVNNRDLTTFQVNVETSFRLAKIIPKTSFKISESGISHPEMILKLKDAGYNGFLIGEPFMKEANPPLALKEFISSIQSLKSNLGT